MLVLTRDKNESIVIGDIVEVTIVEIRGDHVRLGIKAPRDVSVHRREVYDAIHKTTHTMPRASLPPEHKLLDADATKAEATERQPDGTPSSMEDGAGCA